MTIVKIEYKKTLMVGWNAEKMLQAIIIRRSSSTRNPFMNPVSDTVKGIWGSGTDEDKAQVSRKETNIFAALIK